MERFSHPLARRATAALAIAALGVNVGCYSYVAVPAAQETTGRELRVTLAEGSAGELARYLGPRAASLEGKLVGRSDSALTVSVTTVTRTNGVEETWPGDAVVLPRSAIATTATRRPDKVRSILVAGGIVVGVALIAAGITSGQDVNRGGSRVPGGGRQ